MIKFALSLLLFILSTTPIFAADSKILDAQKIKTPSGIEVWLVEDKNVSVISMTFSFEGGLAYDPTDKPGVGRLVSIMLDEGAGEMKSEEFQQKLSDNSINLSFTPGRDAFYGQLKTLKGNRTLAFDLLKLALTQPRFDSDPLERMKNANITQIKNDMGDPSWLVARTFNGMIFEGHPYAQPGLGTIDSIKSITRKDLQNFVAAQFARSALKVAIAGDITKQEAAKAVDTIFADLPENPDPLDNKEAVLQYAGKTILLPLDAPQTYISVGSDGIRRDNKDWYASVVMNYILGGGGFESRLMTEIREKRGLTYGVYSNLGTMRNATLLQANLSASNDKTEEALSILKKEWRKFALNGATDQEIADAKSYLTGSLLLGLTSTNDISETLNSFQREGLDIDYMNTYQDRINAVSADDVKRAATRLLKPENLTVVLVGKPKNITADIMLDSPPSMGKREK